MSLKKSLNLPKGLSKIRHFKKTTITSITSLAVFLMLFANATFANNDLSMSIGTIYHVYYGEEKVGIVDNQEIVRTFEKDAISSFKEKYKEYNFSLSEEIIMIPERVFKSRAANKATLSKLEQVVDIAAETYEISIGNKVIAHVSKDEKMDQFEKNLLLNYVSAEELEQYEQKAKKSDVNIANLEVGDSVIKDIRFSKQLSWDKSSAHPEKIMTTDQVLTMIMQGSLEQEIYKVKKGDVLGTIAQAHDLTLDEIMQINPGINENTLLQIGMELNVTVFKPLVDVVVEKVTKKEEKIPFKTETKDDSSMWKGNSRVTQQGIEGKKIVEYAITYENGRTANSNIISEQVIKEPVTKIVYRGTKTSPSRGTGKLSWPTVGGYISSYQGYRWGRYHKGIDIARPSNYAILAADNGTVTSAGWENGFGNIIRINHNNGMVTLYAHLSSIHVKVGQTVGKGQQIGRMGSTGNSTGIHLHFEVYKNGKLQNPMDYLR